MYKTNPTRFQSPLGKVKKQGHNTFLKGTWDVCHENAQHDVSTVCHETWLEFASHTFTTNYYWRPLLDPNCFPPIRKYHSMEGVNLTLTNAVVYTWRSDKVGGSYGVLNCTKLEWVWSVDSNRHLQRRIDWICFGQWRIQDFLTGGA